MRASHRSCRERTLIEKVRFANAPMLFAPNFGNSTEATSFGLRTHPKEYLLQQVPGEVRLTDGALRYRKSAR